MTRNSHLPTWSLIVVVAATAGALPATAQEAVLQLVNPGPVAGTIVSISPAMSCTTTCSVAVSPGATVTLTANPGPGNLLEQWEGDCTGSAPTCTLIMDETKLAVASFRTSGSNLTVHHRFIPDYIDGQQPTGQLLTENGYLYGMTVVGGRTGGGTIFRECPDGSGHTVLHDFTGTVSDGAYPFGSIVSSGGVFYGMTAWGGSKNLGTVFRINPDGGGFRVVHSFTGGPDDGQRPQGEVVLAEGVLYGMTPEGGTNALGTLFRVNPDGTGFSVLHSFTGQTTDGSSPQGSLTPLGGVLYGMTKNGGSAGCSEKGCGTVFKLNLDGSGYALLHSFSQPDGDGLVPGGSFLVFGGMLYGTTTCGGVRGYGTVFKINPDGTGYELVHEFLGANGAFPLGSLVEAQGVFYGLTSEGGENVRGALFKLNPDGSGATVLYSFLGTPGGCNPHGSPRVLQDSVFGVTGNGGPDSAGTVFSIGTNGTAFQTVHTFRLGTGSARYPKGGLVVAGGDLYGMTNAGGTNDLGTVFRLKGDQQGGQVLHSFARGTADGWGIDGSLLELGGSLYGMTLRGGSSDHGTVFTVRPDGSGYRVTHSFTGSNAGGATPRGALVSLGGALFGMGSDGGSYLRGLIFRINPDGSGFQALHSFAAGVSDGGRPLGSLVAVDGVLFGMTYGGGASDLGTVFRINPDGTGYTVLHSFTGAPVDGNGPWGNLTEAGGALFGLTWAGGASDLGTAFTLNVDGSGFQLLHSFTGGFGDGSSPYGSLIAVDGVLYGTTYLGGAAGFGTVFEIRPDGSGYGLLHSFAGGDGANPDRGSVLTRVGASLFGLTTLGGLSSGAVFSWLIQPKIEGTVTLAGVGLAGVTLAGLPGNPVTGPNGRYEAVVPSGWSGVVTPRGPFGFSPTKRTYSGVTSHLLEEDYTASLAADLALTMTATSEPVAPGGLITYTLSASGFGPSAAAAVNVTDPLPLGVSFVSAAASVGTCAESSGTVTCALGELPAGGYVTMTVVVTAPMLPGLVANTVMATSATPDPSSGNNQATVSTSVGVLVPAGLAVDTVAGASTASNVNGILEPGETVVVAPAWRNPTDVELVVTGTASAWAGPIGAVYSLGDGEAGYGPIAPGQTSSCLATSDCYLVGVEALASRPATHWDANLVETHNSGQAGAWTVHVGASFEDVPVSATFGSFYHLVETLLHSGITAGCTATSYCPTSQVNRGQMAMFLARVTSGGGDSSVPATGSVPGRGGYSCVPGGMSLFDDVAAESQYCRHVHFIAARGVTQGCTVSTYCPADKVSRQAMAMFIARAVAGSDAAVPLFYQDPVTQRVYSCDPAQSSLHFADITASDAFCRHAHFLWAKTVVDGCSTTRYCPGSLVRRDQMAKFLVNGFDLTLSRP